KQHRASCKTKAFNPITKPLFMLHMDLFGPTFVSSLMHKKYCLVVTDDYADEPLVMPLEGIHVDDKLQFVEEPVEIME
ncbi:hypothetical protein Tco_0670275, partial [Tanacetum coccineum]